MRYVLGFLFMLSGNFAFGCRCEFTELNDATAKSDYIALVRVKAILPAKLDSIRYLDDYHFKIMVEEITHFKGTRRTEIIVSGGHPKFNTWTSCDFDINENEEWVVFGRNDRGHAIMYPCSRSIRHADAVGFQDRQYKRGIEELNFLESYFHRSSQIAVRKNGARTAFYANGQRERIEHFRNGKQDGKVQYFYPDGSLYGEGNYRNGLLDDDFKWYSKEGALTSKIHYSMGVLTDTSIAFVMAGPKFHSTYLHVYTSSGKIRLSRSYSGHISMGRVEMETIYFNDAGDRQIRYYYPSGKIRIVENIPKIFGQFDHTEYEESGTILRQRNINERGMLSP